MADQADAAVGMAARMEARIRRRARPFLTPEARKAVALIKIADQAAMCEHRCREAAAAQNQRAEAWKAKADGFKAELAKLPDESRQMAAMVVGDAT